MEPRASWWLVPGPHLRLPLVHSAARRPEFDLADRQQAALRQLVRWRAAGKPLASTTLARLLLVLHSRPLLAHFAVQVQETEGLEQQRVSRRQA